MAECIKACDMCRLPERESNLENVQYNYHHYKICHECGMKVFNLFLNARTTAELTPKEVKQHFRQEYWF